MNHIRVMIVDDHTILRAGLKVLIETQPDMEIVGEAGDAAQAIKLCKACHPDVVLLDLAMPGGGGLRAIEDIRADRPQARVLVLTMHDDQAYLRSSLAAGAAGYLVKRAADAELLSAIRTVHKGRSYIDVALAETSLRDIVDQQADANPAGLACLSQREREVLELVAYGYTNREIASRLHVSPKSVETYRSRVLEKLGLKSRADLVRFALEMGVVRSDLPSLRSSG
jgi:two-component system response regulator NreC